MNQQLNLSLEGGMPKKESSKGMNSGAKINKPSGTTLKNLNKPYYKDKDFELYQADSISLLKILPENSIDMIFADPPYNLSNGGFSIHAGKRVSVNKGSWDKSSGL